MLRYKKNKMLLSALSVRRNLALRFLCFHYIIKKSVVIGIKDPIDLVSLDQFCQTKDELS